MGYGRTLARAPVGAWAQAEARWEAESGRMKKNTLHAQSQIVRRCRRGGRVYQCLSGGEACRVGKVGSR